MIFSVLLKIWIFRKRGCMLFNSWEFILFFPIVSVLYFIIPRVLKNFWLLIASYYFYMSWNPVYALLMMFSTVVTFFSGRVIQKSDTILRKKTIVALSFTINLGILFFFKYANFLIGNINFLFKSASINQTIIPLNVILPVGISFYTFQALSYTVDTYKNNIAAEKSFINYALFVSFFPQLVAGPIEKSRDLLPQLSRFSKFDVERCKSGLYLILWGFFQKLFISNKLAVIVDNVYNNYKQFSGFHFWIASFAFAIQIYTDFSAYTDIATGCARILGFDLSRNFLRPYFSKSIAEFWRRWHITLGAWFKEYVYFPLGGSRVSKKKMYRNILIVFLLSGLWHGASWTFVIWGFIHAFYQIIGDFLKPIRIKITKLLKVDVKSTYFKVWQVTIVFILVTISWVFFRAKSLIQAKYIIKRMFLIDLRALFDIDLFFKAIKYSSNALLFVMINVMILLIVSLLRRNKSINKLISSQHFLVRYSFYIILMTALVFYWVSGQSLVNTTFIYFQF